jgi:small subunit ribosomal protein S6
LNEYEIMLLLDPDAPEERHEEIIARTRELVERAGGKWNGHDPWGRRKLAYQIAHKDEAIYHVVYFTCTAEALDEVSRVLRITDGVLRHGAYRRTSAPTVAPRPHRPSRSDEAAEYAGSLTEPAEGE